MESKILIWAIGVLVGLLLGELLIYLRKSYGVLKIDHSNPEKDIYRLDIDDLDTLSKKKFIVLEVDNNADLSQK